MFSEEMEGGRWREKSVPQRGSHKIIEKRRRDRINNCLVELTEVVPVAFSKQSRGKLEKAEILEMTVDYLRAVQATELGRRFERGEWYSVDIWEDFLLQYQTGYRDCMREAIGFLAETEGLGVNDPRRLRMVAFLQSRFYPEAAVSAGMAVRRSDELELNAAQKVPALEQPPLQTQIPVDLSCHQGDTETISNDRFFSWNSPVSRTSLRRHFSGGNIANVFRPKVLTTRPVRVGRKTMACCPDGSPGR